MPPSNSLSLDEQMTLLKRGTVGIVPEDVLRAKLAKSAQTGKPLRVKLGLDPTAPDIHLGFAVVLRKLRQFQDLGHTVVLIIGDYTALIGDPSGRSATRPMLSEEAIKSNAATYIDQLAVILDREKTEVRFNSEWLGTLGFAETVQLASRMTVAQVMAREDFAKRWDAHQPISLHELLYPLAQAYDSVAIHADVELGGQDQTFNILAGRDLQAEVGQEQQVGMFLPLLVGLDGHKKMSKSLGNYIGIRDEPSDMFGKVMSIGDDMLHDYFILCTDVPEPEVEKLAADAKSGAANPRDVKMRLGWEIVNLYHGPAAADAARDAFIKQFSKHEVPEDVPDLVVPAEDLAGGDSVSLQRLVVLSGQAKSGGEAKRLIEQGGVQYDGAKVTDPKASVPVSAEGTLLKVGKRYWARVTRQG